MKNLIVVLLLIIILGGIIWYLIKQKKQGSQCVGCPYASRCHQKCSKEQ